MIADTKLITIVNKLHALTITPMIHDWDIQVHAGRVI